MEGLSGTIRGETSRKEGFIDRSDATQSTKETGALEGKTAIDLPIAPVLASSSGRAQLGSPRKSSRGRLLGTVFRTKISGNPTFRGQVRLLLSSTIGDPRRRAFIRSLTGDDAQHMVDYLNVILQEKDILASDEGKHALSLLCELARSARVYPRCYVLKGIKRDSNISVEGGSFADIYKGKHKKKSVCLKIVRSFGREQNARILRTFTKELVLWAHLSHDNILPFYGAYFLDERIWLVSPWMDNGDLHTYLASHPETPRVPLLLDIINGLVYLHQTDIVHGDLKAKNILISNDERALIADFGLSYVATASKLPSTKGSNGTIRWMAPELFNSDLDSPYPTRMSDIWSFGCVCYEVLARKYPYYQYNDAKLIRILANSKEMPARPSPGDGSEFIDDNMWGVMQSCWNHTPEKRPDSKLVQKSITDLDKDNRPPVPIKIDTFREEMVSMLAVKVEYELVKEILLGIERDAVLGRIIPPNEPASELGQSRDVRSTEPLEVHRLLPSWIKRLLDLVKETFGSGLLKPTHQKIQSDVLAHQNRLRLLLSSVMMDAGQRNSVHKLTDDEAQCMADYFDLVLHNAGILESEEGQRLLSSLCRLAKSAGVYPRCYRLEKEVKRVPDPIAGGGFADVYMGDYRGQAVCLKVLRIFRGHDMNRLLRTHVKELMIWAHLSHPNILPFYGAYLLNHRICLVSPWMKNGNLRNYLVGCDYGIPRLPLLLDIMDGLAYLHQRNIVHGDLKMEDILISDDERALIADFGLSHVATTGGLTTTFNGIAHTHWRAPELVDGSCGSEFVRPKKESDIWSFGCLCYEVLSRKIPFYQYNHIQVTIVLLKGEEIPLRPSPGHGGDMIDDRMWAIMGECWNYEPDERPSCLAVRGSIVGLQFPDVRPPVLSQVRDSGTFWNAMKARSGVEVDYEQAERILLRVQTEARA